MNAALPSQPSRIVKRADVAGMLEAPAAFQAGAANPAATGSAASLARRVAKEARLVPGAPGTSLVEVRCSCGEWTRVELHAGDRPSAEERR